MVFNATLNNISALSSH